MQDYNGMPNNIIEGRYKDSKAHSQKKATKFLIRDNF